MTSLSRSTLKRVFPDDPGARAEFERLDELLSSVNGIASGLFDKVNALNIPDAGQPASPLLDAVAGVSDTDLGVFEKTDQNQVILREVDSADDACLVSRLNLMSFVGKGATASRPTLSAQRRAIYFDTTLSPLGKPIFWTGANWVDYTGAAV